jgi:hypothetical protein
MYVRFSAATEEDARAVMSRTIAANPSLSGGVFALLLTLVCTQYYISTFSPIYVSDFPDTYYNVHHRVFIAVSAPSLQHNFVLLHL